MNPDHLYLGTQSDNVRDQVLRNPNCSGRNVKVSRFYEGETWLMKKLWNSKKVTQVQIAKMFKCSPSTINQIVNEKTINFKI